MLEWAWIASAAVIGSMLCFAALSGVGRSRRAFGARLLGEPTDGPEPGPWSLALAGLVPIRPSVREKIRMELSSAGFRDRSAMVRYAAARGAMTAVPLFAAALASLRLEPGSELTCVASGLIGSGLGFSLPRVYVQARGRDRTRQIEKGLPVAVDLLALCLTAGQDLQSAVGRVGRDLGLSHPALAEELRLTHRLAELHSLNYAFGAMSERTPVGEVRNLMLLLIQSGRLGTGVATALTELADGYRIGLRQRAEAQANRTSFWMLFPTTFCLLVSAAIILIAPAYLEFSRQRMGNLREISGVAGPPAPPGAAPAAAR